jgi:two-component system, OmpR family, sensor histidine kinase KdpD
MVVLFRKVIPANQTTVALSFLVLVLVTASRWRLAYSVYLSLFCTLLYNFFFLPPVGKLTISDPENWATLAAFLCTSVLVSHLAEKEHREAESSEARRREVEMLYKFSQQLLLQEDPRALSRSTPSIAASIFGFRAVALYVREEDAVYYSDPGNELLPMIDLKLTADNSEAAVSSVNGLHVIQLLLGVRHSLGILAVTDGNLSAGVYEAIGSLVSIALGHAAAQERNSRLEASRESERLRSALLDSVTHDLRTPLTSIRAATTTLISQPELPELERTELITIVDEEGARLDRLIGQAVEMAQLDAEALQVNLQPQGVRELIELTVEEMQPSLRNHAVEIRASEEIPAVPMDRTLVHRVLRHLIENAAKYSPADYPITITATRDEYRLLITVADRGPGIDPDEQPFVFDKYFRGKKHRFRATGTGMGLAIVRAILNTHHGGIELVSQPGEGARFTFWLPLSGRAQEF